jgi:SAM-dependent methyltransferase
MMGTEAPAYSQAFFDTFAVTIPDATTSVEVDGVARLAPPDRFSRLLDIACGIGRTTRLFAERGYRVSGIDASVEGLRRARQATPGGRFVALDFRHVGRMRWQFDVVTSFWNSLGFATPEGDQEMFLGVHQILRPGGRLMLDLYHPEWLATHELHGVVDPRGATVDRWLAGGRSCHVFRYPDGSTEDISFQVYHPDEMEKLLKKAGLRVDGRLVWWRDEIEPGPDQPRYQLVCTRS